MGYPAQNIDPVRVDQEAVFLAEEILRGETVEIGNQTYSLFDVEQHIFENEKLSDGMTAAIADCAYGQFCEGGLKMRAVVMQAAGEVVDKAFKKEGLL